MRTPGYGITPDRFVRVAHLLPRQRGNVAVDNHTFVNVFLVKSVFRVSSLIFFGLGLVPFCWTRR